jgi:hypothetical protein
MRIKAFLVLSFVVLVVALVTIFNRPSKNTRHTSTPNSQYLYNETTVNEYALEQNSGCYSCHGNMRDIKGMHAQAGCIACHSGNGKANTKEAGHEGMISVPGNFADMEQTCGSCHPQSIHHISNSIMSTNSGLVNVDRYILGEMSSPDGHSDIKDIGQSAADNHLRMLCANCHLGKEKTEVGPATQLSRGGGCTACHSNYSKGALASHVKLKEGIIRGITYHPTMDTRVGNDHCFGCHSRSGRISTNYEGWHETMFREGDKLPEGEEFRLLEDKRYFTRMPEDLHHTLGLQCIDCHVYSGIMGDGKRYMHEEDAVKIACEDCHFKAAPSTKVFAELSETEKRIYIYREYNHTEMLVVHKDSTAILNSYLNASKKPMLKSKFTKQEWALSAPGATCTRSHGHSNVSCSACHSGWAPQCTGCHVDYKKNVPGFDLLEDKKVQGTWVESAGGFFAELPPMGVYRYKDSSAVTSAVPGMIMTLDKSGYHGHEKSSAEFFRLYAPAKPHTTMAKGRDCKSCHNNPLALGYGRGSLVFVKDPKNPHWTFDSEYELAEDGLPLDAWIPFLGERKGKVSTRLNFTPLTIKEQQRMLTVGACLTCHGQQSALMLRSLHMNFEELKKQMTEACREPVF